VAFEGVANRAAGIAFVVDHESAGITEVGDIASQDPNASRVEGADPEIRGRHAENLLHSFAHFARGLVGEGHREDIFGRDTARPDEIGDAVGEHPGLATAGTGQHENRAFRRFDGGALLRVQRCEHRLSLQVGCLPGFCKTYSEASRVGG